MVELALNADDLALNTLIAGLADQGWTADAMPPSAKANRWLADITLPCRGAEVRPGLA